MNSKNLKPSKNSPVRRLLSVSCYSDEYKALLEDSRAFQHFLTEHGFDGIEVLQIRDWDRALLEELPVMGVHLSFSPMWLDFWRGNATALEAQFGDLATVESFYGSLDPSHMIDYWAEEMHLADLLGASYAVLHAGHVTLEHCYNYAFDYDDGVVLSAVEEVLSQLEPLRPRGLRLLVENLWWPGLNLKDPALTQGFLSALNQPDQGLMLDFGHYLNTQVGLRSLEEAVAAIQTLLMEQPDLKQWTQGVHLNCSLSDAYLQQHLSQLTPADVESASKPHRFMEAYFEAFPHISELDQHEPFLHEDIGPVLEDLDLSYLVYEFKATSFEGIREKIIAQNRVLGIETP